LIRKEESRGIWKKENEKNVVYNSSINSASAADDLSDDRVPSIARTSPFRRNVICIGTITTTAATASHNEKSGGERDQMDVAYILSMCVCGRDESKETFEKDTHTYTPETI